VIGLSAAAKRRRLELSGLAGVGGFERSFAATVGRDGLKDGGWLAEAAVPCGYGGVAQLGEHLLCKQRVMGSSPFTSTAEL
jgi:hypothetical protein